MVQLNHEMFKKGKEEKKCVVLYLFLPHNCATLHNNPELFPLLLLLSSLEYMYIYIFL